MRSHALAPLVLLAPLFAGAQQPPPPLGPQRAVIVPQQGTIEPQAPGGARFAGEPPGITATQQEHKACVERNRPALDLWHACDIVIANVRRRDELNGVGERLQWKDQSRPNVERARAELAAAWARYQSAGGKARAPEEVSRAVNPCLEADERVRAAVREAYRPGPSPVQRSGVMIGSPPK